MFCGAKEGGAQMFCGVKEGGADMKKLGFIGCGHMGEAMLAGALRSGWCGAADVLVHTCSQARMSVLKEQYGIETVSDNAAVAGGAVILVLAVKPQSYADVLTEIKAVLDGRQILMPISPAWSIQAVRGTCERPDQKVVRAMPNTPALLGEGMSGYTLAGDFSEDERSSVERFFQGFGRAMAVPESLMNAVGSVSGSSPAFVYMMIEAMAEGAVRCGMPADMARVFAAQSVRGAAQMVLETGRHPAELRDAVCSAGGTTIAGVAALEKAAFKSAVIEAMAAASERFEDLQV